MRSPQSKPAPKAARQPQGLWRCALVALWIGLLTASPLPGQDRLDGPCGLNPKGKPKRIKGGEAFPPLPLPATPLRRTERKRNPSPPALIGKIQWGEERAFRGEGGGLIHYNDWDNDPSDVKRLLEIARRQLGIRYKSQAVDLKAFSFNPDEVPVLWISGTRPPRFTEEDRGKIRVYLEKGGTLWGDACRGSPSFSAAFRREISLILPDRPMRPLAPDHPVFSCAVNLEGRAKYTPWTTDWPEGAPYLEGINIGCRTAVFFCPYALSCAWDSGHVTEGCPQMLEQSAIGLGMNLLAYTLAYRPLGSFLSRTPGASAVDPEPGGFVFAQVRFQGEYNPDPGAFAALLKALSTRTRIRVSLRHPFVALNDPGLTDYPFLYMTGHGPFALGPEEIAGLRNFLDAGGFLLADACCGDLEFDRSFRRAMAVLFAAAALERIPREDPLYQTPEKIRSVAYTPKILATWPGLNQPVFEGIAAEGAWRVVYSRFDLGCGWEGETHPYRMGHTPDDAIRIAVNVIVYAMTH